jgi:adenylate cyclase
MPHNNSNNTDSALPTHQEPPSSSHASSLDIQTLMPREQRVIVVCDVVESVRWMEHDEDNAITRWSQFAAAVRSRIAPEHAGNVVKSTGDGLMLEFESAPQAVAAANAMQKLSTEGNAGFEPERQMHLRVGIHQAQVRRDAHDLYGHGVNLAARISTLAGPGEIIVTPEVRDHLTDSLDGDIEDMGECYLKHLSEPQRVYRVSDSQGQAVEISAPKSVDLKPVIAIVPFDNQCNEDGSWAIGELIADGIIAQLSRSSEVKILSRLSTRTLRGRIDNLLELAKTMKATHVLSGYYIQVSSSLKLVYELSQINGGEVVDAGQVKSSIAELLSEDSDSIKSISVAISAKLMQAEAIAVKLKPLPSLHGYSLLLGGIQGMHHSSLDQFEKTRDLFEHLIERHPRNSDPRSWFAKWHVLNAVRNLGQDKNKLAASALTHTQRALDSKPDDSLAMCMQGFVYLHLRNDLESAQIWLENALRVNPNEAFAWLISSVLASFQNQPNLAVQQSQTAMELSPVDPLRYYFLSLRASALLSANLLESAIEAAKKSLRLNLYHSPTLRVLLTAQVENGQVDDAKSTLVKLLRIQPTLTISNYLATGSQSKTRLQCARALQEAGLT